MHTYLCNFRKLISSQLPRRDSYTISYLSGVSDSALLLLRRLGVHEEEQEEDQQGRLETTPTARLPQAVVVAEPSERFRKFFFVF